MPWNHKWDSISLCTVYMYTYTWYNERVQNKRKTSGASSTTLDATRFIRLPVRGRTSSAAQSSSVTARPHFTRCFTAHAMTSWYLQSASYSFPFSTGYIYAPPSRPPPVDESLPPCSSRVAAFLYHVSSLVGQAIGSVCSTVVGFVALHKPCRRCSCSYVSDDDGMG